MGSLIKDIVKTATSEAVGKVADAYTEAKRLELEKERELQRIEEEKRKARHPIMVILIIASVVALGVVWVLHTIPLWKLLATIIIVPLLILFIKKL